MTTTVRSMIPLSALLLACAIVQSCSSPGPDPIRYGQDNCDYCRMTIVDSQFGAELVTSRGKVYRYDSIECLAASALMAIVPASEIHSMWVTDFCDRGGLVSAERAIFVHSNKLRSPMGVGLLACTSRDKAAETVRTSEGEIVSWKQIEGIVAETWDLHPQQSAQSMVTP